MRLHFNNSAVIANSKMDVKNTDKEVSFEKSDHGIFFTDSKVRTAY